jgi:gamma-butyrobetaine dioxygenase
MPGLTSARIVEGGSAIELDWTDGRAARFHAVWLRDNSPDPQTRSPVNGQRLITVLGLPEDVRVGQASAAQPHVLKVLFLPENREAVFSAEWLRQRIYDRAMEAESGWTPETVTRWGCELLSSIPRADFREVAASRRALRDWLAAVRRYGFALLTDAPCASGGLLQVVELFGYVRETNYGRWFEVRAEVNPSNLAYTNLGLQAHTDNPYRDPVPTLQLLACLENTVSGGESVVVDGFEAVRRLKASNPDGFALLSRYCARFEYSGSAGVRLSARRPMIELAPDGELIAVRFNNRSLAAVTDVPYERLPDYYRAYREFAHMIEEPALAVSFKLEPGELFIVDNTRVLHARKAFSGSGTRWLQGCYADKDGLLSTLTALEEETMAEAAE